MKRNMVIIALLAILSLASINVKAQRVRFNVSVGNDGYYPGYYYAPAPVYQYYPPRYYTRQPYPRYHYRRDYVRPYSGYRQGYKSHGYYRKNYSPRPHRGHGNGHWKGRGKGHYKHHR